jgi:formylglycine-generating enzyme required for sulfatase activity
MAVDPTEAQAEIRRLASQDSLIVVAGAGVAINATIGGEGPTAPTWGKLLENGLAWLAARGVRRGATLDARRIAHLRRKLSTAGELFNDGLADMGTDELLSVAEAVHGAMLDTHQLSDWLDNELGRFAPPAPALIEALRDLGRPILTTNYDTVIEDVLGWETITWHDTEQLRKALTERREAVIHIHGVYRRPKTVVLGRHSYEKIRNDAAMQALEQALTTLKHLLYVGCGATTDDPNLGELARWKRSTLGGAGPASYLLVRTSEAEGADAALFSGDKVDVVPYGSFPDLLPFVRGCSPDAAPPQDDPATTAEPTPTPLDLGALTRENVAKIAWMADLFGGHWTIEDVAVELCVAPEERRRHARPEARPDAGRPDAGRPQTVPLTALLDRPERHWTLIGPAGSGKSTLLRRLVHELAPAEGPQRGVPVFVHAQRIVTAHQSGARGSDLLSAALQEDYPEGAGAQAQAAGKALVLLVDGYDEAIAENNQRGPVRDALNALLQAIPDVRTIVASRPEARPQELLGAHAARVAELSEDGAVELVVRILGDEDKREQAQQRIQAWRAEPATRELTTSPLLLTLVALLWQEGEDVPEARAEVFDRAVELLLARGHAPGSHERWPIPRRRYVRQALERICAECHADRRDPWSTDRVIAALEGDPRLAGRLEAWYNDDLEAFLNDQAERVGLLVRARTGAGWTAPHRSLREHLAARGMLAAWTGAEPPACIQRAVKATGRDAGRYAELFALMLGALEEHPERAAQVFGWLVGAAEQAQGAQRERALDVVWRAFSGLEGLTAALAKRLWGLRRGDGRPEFLETAPREDDAYALVQAVLAQLPEPAALPLLAAWLEDCAARWNQRAETVVAAEAWACVRALQELSGPQAPAIRRFFQAVVPDHDDARQAVLRALDFRRVPAGRFWMGSPEEDDQATAAERPRHLVEVAAPVDVARDPVTAGLYACFDPAHRIPLDADHPVVNVDHYEASLFAAWVATLSPSLAGCRLPTETEWEHACRWRPEGTPGVPYSRFFAGDTPQGWHDENSDHRTHAVSDEPPGEPAHPLGLRHLHGNVREWCAASWDSLRYAARTAPPAAHRHDPRERPPEDHPRARRMFRGGSWRISARWCRAAYRSGWRPTFRVDNQGFRLVLVPAPGRDH